MPLVSGFRSPAPEKAGCFHDGSRNGVSGATNTQGTPLGTSTPTAGGRVPELQRHQPQIQTRHTRHTRGPHSLHLIAEKRATGFRASPLRPVGLRPARDSWERRPRRPPRFPHRRPQTQEPFGVRKSDLRVGAACDGVFTDTELNR